MSRRALYKQSTDPDGVETGEDWTDAASGNVEQLWLRSNEQITNIGGTATAITGSVAFDSANFTYVDGRSLWFIAASDSAGATTINVGGLGAIAVQDSKGDPITASTWEAGDLVSGIISGGALKLTGNGGTGSSTPASSGALKKAWAVNVANEIDSAGGIMVEVTNVQGDAGDYIELPSFYVEPSGKIGSGTFGKPNENQLDWAYSGNDGSLVLSVYRDATKLWDIVSFDIEQTSGNPGEVDNVVYDTNPKDIGTNPFIVAIPDANPHDYSIRCEAFSGGSTITLNVIDVAAFKLFTLEAGIIT